MRKYTIILFVILSVLSSCSTEQPSCDSKITYSESLDSSLALIENSNDFILLIVRDTTEISQVVDSFFTKNNCWVDSLNKEFKAIVSHSLPAKIKKKSFDKILVDFQNEHKLSLPFAVALGQNDTVFTYISLKTNHNTQFVLDSVWMDLISEIRSDNLRDDYTFLHGAEKEKYLTPKYHSWVKEIVAFKSYNEKEHKLILEIHNPNRVRIVAEGTNQRDYMTPLHILMDDDSIPIPFFKWTSQTQTYYDDFLKKNYHAYTDSVIFAEAHLEEGVPTSLETYPIRVSYSAYLPKRKVMVNSVVIPVNPKINRVDSIN